jgi:dTDP-4-amino-4,6-dideoxygalactose transaminase
LKTMSERLAVDGGRPTRAEQLPLHRPWFDQREASAVNRVLAGTHVAGDGACGKELERLLRDSTGVRGVLAVNSCTAALEMAHLPISAAFTDRDCDDIVAACVKVFERMATLAL